jgi:hypothetical protein
MLKLNQKIAEGLIILAAFFSLKRDGMRLRLAGCLFLLGG